jgi:PAS domain S-box-containing protein
MHMEENKTEHLYRALRSIREVDRLLIKEKDRSRLLQAICDTLIKNRSYYNAWIVYVDETGRVIETAEAGLGAHFEPMRERLRRGRFTECGRRALGRESVVVVDEPYDRCSDCPLSEMYSGRSAMTVRLENEGQVYGLLCVSLPRPFTANEEEHELLREIAGDIAYGLNKIALEEELRENRQSFQDLVENSSTGILIVQDGVVVYRNPVQETISGSFHDVGERLVFDNVHPEDREKIEDLYEKVRSGAEKTIRTNLRFYPTGKTNHRANVKWVYFQASDIDYKGRPAVLINMIDITESKELEQLVVVKDKMVSLGHIAAGVAHEIRNPLSGINIYLNTLENVLGDSSNPEMTARIIEQIQSASRKIESIIKRVIDFSKPGEPRLELSDINTPVEEALALTSVTMRKREVSVTAALSDDVPRCYIDPTLIEEVVLNIVNNAAEALEGAGGDKRILVTTRAENENVVLTISDSGPGIPPELRTKVLEPFFTTKGNGTGIGLSLCYRIVSDHGGTLTVGQSEWSGAEFVIRLPAGEND